MASRRTWWVVGVRVCQGGEWGGGSCCGFCDLQAATQACQRSRVYGEEVS